MLSPAMMCMVRSQAIDTDVDVKMDLSPTMGVVPSPDSLGGAAMLKAIKRKYTKTIDDACKFALIPIATVHAASAKRIADKTCRICGDCAVGFNFAVVCCGWINALSLLGDVRIVQGILSPQRDATST